MPLYIDSILDKLIYLSRNRFYTITLLIIIFNNKVENE